MSLLSLDECLAKASQIDRSLASGAQTHRLSSQEWRGEICGVVRAFAQGVEEIAAQMDAPDGVSIGSTTGSINVQGETQTQLDARADDILTKRFLREKSVLAVVSEEQAELVSAPDLALRCEELQRTQANNGALVVGCDPLDGSSNIPFNIPVGSIFAVYSIPYSAIEASPAGLGGQVNTSATAHVGSVMGERKAQDPSFAQQSSIKQSIVGALCGTPLRHQVLAAGYAVYGRQTQLVLSLGDGVMDFVWERKSGRFVLRNERLQTPTSGAIYSVNEGASHSWEALPTSAPIARFVDELKREGGFSGRYVGSLVSDFDRNLRKGGIYLYPPDGKNKQGKLRALYEAIPLAYLCEQAGGQASCGTTAILDHPISAIHERVPLYIGSSGLVERLSRLF